MNHTIGDFSRDDWKGHLSHASQEQATHYNSALQLLHSAYMMEDNKDYFWVFHNNLWKTCIWNTYRDTLFHDPQDPSSPLIYLNFYNISNQVNPNDPLWPLYTYLLQGSLPHYTPS